MQHMCLAQPLLIGVRCRHGPNYKASRTMLLAALYLFVRAWHYYLDGLTKGSQPLNKQRPTRRWSAWPRLRHRMHQRSTHALRTL